MGVPQAASAAQGLPKPASMRVARSRADAEREGEALMQAYVAGDERAFDALFEHYAPTVLRLGRRHLGSEEDARELVQQTFLRLHGARRDYKPDEPLHPWLMTIVMNLVRDHWRRRRRKPSTTLEHEPAAPLVEEGASIERRQRAEELHAALGSLSASQREVIELHWLQERPFAEVARVLGITVGTARVRAHRGYAKLKQALLRAGVAS
jgi:RNA polymerase sigma-70 factor (ECF subfamily)